MQIKSVQVAGLQCIFAPNNIKHSNAININNNDNIHTVRTLALDRCLHVQGLSNTLLVLSIHSEVVVMISDETIDHMVGLVSKDASSPDPASSLDVQFVHNVVSHLSREKMMMIFMVDEMRNKASLF